MPQTDEALSPERAGKKKRRSRYRTWAELLARTFGVDALACPVGQGRVRRMRRGELSEDRPRRPA